MQLPLPRFMYGTAVLNGQMWDDEGHLVTGQTMRDRLVMELLDDFEVIEKEVGTGCSLLNEIK